MFFTKSRIVFKVFTKKQLSLWKKPASEKISRHNPQISSTDTSIPQEFSTFSTGFSTGLMWKSVGKSRLTYKCGKISTDLHKPVEGPVVNINQYRGKIRTFPVGCLYR